MAYETFVEFDNQSITHNRSSCFIFNRDGFVLQDHGIIFYCNIKEGMQLQLLESTDIVTDTNAAVQRIISGNPKIAGIINFHCILRTLELKDKCQTDAYGQIFANIPIIGLSTYGEEFIGHINQTSTMLILHK